MLLSLLLSCAVLSETPDTLAAATVSAERAVTVSRTDTVSISQVEPPAVTDVLLRTPGLIVSDNGGGAGLKTVSLRGLGSPHTTVRIDGIKVSNVQSGQGDLGMLDVMNAGCMVVDYAQNSIDFRSLRPTFDFGRKVGGAVGMSAGSFGTYLPYGRVDVKLSDRIAISASGSGNVSRGDFLYGDGLRRENNDLKQYKASLDGFGSIRGGDWSAKAYISGAGRGTPGSISWPSTDREKDLESFVQGQVRRNFGRLYSMNLCGKVSYDKTQYFSSYGNSDYGQAAVQLGSGNRFHPLKWLDVSITADFEWDRLKATYYDASRISTTAGAGACFKLPRFKADLTLEYDGTFDKDGLSCNVISPAADFRVELGGGVGLGGFARRAFRTPTFNELYYPGYGNPSLRPEDAILTDLGIDWSKSFGKEWAVAAKADGFFNMLSDKITSAPNPEDPSLWMPYNIDTVKAWGIDTEAGFRYEGPAFQASFSARYSFQNADNVPYLSRHSVVLSGEFSYKTWRLSPIWNYRGGRRDSYGDMEDWNSLDLTFSKSFMLGKRSGREVCGPLTLTLSGRNLTGTRYELVSGYPYPSRSFLISLSFRF